MLTIVGNLQDLIEVRHISRHSRLKFFAFCASPFKGRNVMKHLVEEFTADWLLAQRAKTTVRMYASYLQNLFALHDDPTFTQTKQWIGLTDSPSVRRKKGQAIRAFGKWAQLNGIDVFSWWKAIPVAKEGMSPQLTVTEEMYAEAKTKVSTPRDQALIEVLWSSGLRRSEIARINTEDINFTESFLVIRQTKTGNPRIAPISPAARRALIKHLGKRKTGSVFQLNSNSIRIRLRRLGLPSAHAWRRGWAVHSLRNGVSEVSVRSAAGWSSGAMVARYTRALSGELAVEEFQRSWTAIRMPV